MTVPKFRQRSQIMPGRRPDLHSAGQIVTGDERRALAILNLPDAPTHSCWFGYRIDIATYRDGQTQSPIFRSVSVEDARAWVCRAINEGHDIWIVHYPCQLTLHPVERAGG